MNKLLATIIQEDPVIRKIKKNLRRINRRLFYLKLSLFISYKQQDFFAYLGWKVINPLMRYYRKRFPNKIKNK